MDVAFLGSIFNLPLPIPEVVLVILIKSSSKRYLILDNCSPYQIVVTSQLLLYDRPNEQGNHITIPLTRSIFDMYFPKSSEPLLNQYFHSFFVIFGSLYQLSKAK